MIETILGITMLTVNVVIYVWLDKCNREYMMTYMKNAEGAL